MKFAHTAYRVVSGAEDSQEFKDKVTNLVGARVTKTHYVASHDRVELHVTFDNGFSLDFFYEKDPSGMYLVEVEERVTDSDGN